VKEVKKKACDDAFLTRLSIEVDLRCGAEGSKTIGRVCRFCDVEE
jgi:hypothetical protein